MSVELKRPSGWQRLLFIREKLFKGTGSLDARSIPSLVMVVVPEPSLAICGIPLSSHCLKSSAVFSPRPRCERTEARHCRGRPSRAVAPHPRSEADYRRRRRAQSAWGISSATHCSPAAPHNGQVGHTSPSPYTSVVGTIGCSGCTRASRIRASFVARKQAARKP